jgi:hypothetical protein
LDYNLQPGALVLSDRQKLIRISLPVPDQQAQECLRRGLNWIVQHLDLVVPDDLYEPDQIKETAELSILYGSLTTWSISGCDVALSSIQNHLLDFLSNPKVAEWVRKLPAFYSPYVVAYLPLRSVGLRIASFEQVLKPLHRAGYPHLLETTPYRELELQYLVWKAGIDPRPPVCGPVYRRTALGRCRNPIYFSTEEVYSVTHTVIYLTDFAQNIRSLGEGQKLGPREIVATLLLHCRRKQDWDLSSELLLNMVGLGAIDTPLFAACLQAVLEAWRSDGALPGPGFPSLPPDPTRRQFFQRCYHTTLVGSLLCGAYLHGQREQTNHADA